MKRALILAAALLLATPLSNAGCYSEGVRMGEIQKFSQKGLVNKSWEGEMVQDGFRTKDSGKVTNIWKFSVTDTAVAKKINDAMFEGGKVAVKYCQSAWNSGLLQNTSYTVTDAKAVK